MFNTTYIPARKLQKSYKGVIEEVKTKKEPVVLTVNNEPQAAVVSLEDLESLRKFKNYLANREMFEIAKKAAKELTYLPANLREQADEILYGKGSL